LYFQDLENFGEKLSIISNVIENFIFFTKIVDAVF